ncbi:MAG: hypothetical protein PVH41_06120, partial [Anaerolineae bacterium]
MTRSRSPRSLFVALCAIAALLLGYPATTAATGKSPFVKDPVSAAWQRAQDAGVYRFSTTVVETTHPAPTLANVGRGSREERTYLEGETNLPESTMHLTLWPGGGSVFPAQDGVELRIEGSRAYVREAGGPWRETDGEAAVFAPGNDLMGYLVGANNLREVGTESRSFPGSQGDRQAIRATRYAFDFNGPRVAGYMRDQLEGYLREKGELPAGLHLDTSERFRNAIGEGEVWIDGDGLPLRLSLHIEYPQRRDGERQEADIKTDFSGFDRRRLVAAARPLARVSRTLGLPQTPEGGRRLRQQGGLAVGTLGMLGMVVALRRSKVAYAALILAIIGSMVVTPVLQGQQAHAFSQRLAADRAEQQRRLEEEQEAEEALELLNGSDWNPRQDPDAAEKARESAASLVSDMGADPALGIAAPLSRAQSPASAETTEDDDEDGVPNDDDPCDDDDDCDDDGLTDLQESRLGTDLEAKDSDVDQITDDVEVAGFYDNGMWYLDPNNPDSNDDGLTDTAECPQLIEDGPSPASACQDTDNDGTPDVFDHDNDDDGVPDRMDLSPFSWMDNNGSPFNDDNPLALIVSDLEPGEPAFVDFQLRPDNEEHLWHALNVFDWPSGDEEGQIHRKSGNNSTFADVESGGERVAPNADNGDMRLIPMMEIEMTGDTVPLKLTNPEISARVEGEITGTVMLVQDGDDIQLDFTFEGAGTYDVEIQDGSCLEAGDTEYTFTDVISGDTGTISDRSLIDLANSERILTVSDGGQSACANLGNVINGPYDDQMIDPAPLRPYGITVREKNEDGVLLAYVPLGLVNDETGGDRVAFSARMHYWPESEDWGDTQTVRVVWLVQMLVDQCTERPCSDDENWLLDQTKVVYTYLDEWYLTGLSVREDHGLEVAIVFEDPAEEPSDEDRMYDDFLWKLAHGLGATFMTGRDDDGDGLRDITISEIDSRFDVTSTATITQRWGISPTVTMAVETFAYEHEDFAAHIMMTETRKIL